MLVVPSLLTVKMWDNLLAVTSLYEMQQTCSYTQSVLTYSPKPKYLFSFREYLLHGLEKSKLDSSFISN